MQIKQFFISALTIIVFLGLVSCHKDNSKINILVAAPFTGEAASYGKVLKEGIEIALSELEADPVKKRLNVIYRDSKLSLKEIVNILHQEISIHPISVVMPVSTSESLILAPICNKNKIILLPPLADGDQLTNAGPYVYRISPTSSFQGKELARAVIGGGHARAAVLSLNDAWGTGLSEAFKDSFQKKGGEVVAMEICNPGQTDLRLQLEKIRMANPSALVILIHPAETIPALKQIRELVIKAQLYGGDTFSNKAIYNEAADLAQGVVFALPSQPDNEAFRKFSTLYKSKYGTSADINAAAARDAIMLIAEAVRKGAKNGESIKMEFEKLNAGFEGATGLIKWDKNGDVVSKNYGIFRIEGKGYKPLIIK
jgi:branched-chain amino acid transport system substrate-binding protein